MNVLDYIRVVLVEPTHPGNIGATARAMANMGVGRLALVRPRDFPSAEATARAAGADAILTNAVVAEDLDSAIADCALVLGASARTRAINWPQLPPTEAMQKAAATVRAGAGRAHAAVLFGRESSGLTNRELERCHHLVRIPADPAFPSLNIAAAVMVLLYELRQAVAADESDEADRTNETGKVDNPHATAEEMRHFYQHLHQLLNELQFGKTSTDKRHRKLSRLFNRAQLYAQEVRMLRGIFTAVQEKLNDS